MKTIYNFEEINNLNKLIQENEFNDLLILAKNYEEFIELKEKGFYAKEKKQNYYLCIKKGKNPFKYSNNYKRYHTLDYHLKEKYNHKVAKIPINAGFTCPNIDGNKSFGGCTFCSIKGSGDFAGLPTDNLLKQWYDGKKMMQKKWPNAKFIAYFQAFSNTYAPLDVLKEKFEPFTTFEECIGIDIATRPDCLDDEIIAYLSDLNKRCNLIVELGLQTIHEKTATIINRQHDLETFIWAVESLRKNDIQVVVHIINGLPKETKEMMLETAKFVGNLDIQGLKIHLLHVTSDSQLVKQLNNNFLTLLSKDEYIEIVCEQLTLINPKIVIHRLTGDAPIDTFIGPIWSKKKGQVLNDIDNYLLNNNLYQGKNIKKP